jgi:hypothetical protein
VLGMLPLHFLTYKLTLLLCCCCVAVVLGCVATGGECRAGFQCCGWNFLA